jgi:hypothetical protein
VWQALGDCSHYVEPFAGSLAVLLNRPHVANRTYYSETVNDLDALLVNFWRAIQADPQAVAEAASWPVTEIDKHARGCALLKWRENEARERMAGDPEFYDAKMAGWWVWCVCVTIGGWGLGGPWWPDADGKLRKRPRGWQKQQAAESDPGVVGNRPHLSNNGMGVNHSQMREPGVRGDRPHLGNNGMGVNRPQMREPGLAREQIVEADYAATGGFHPMTMPELRRWFDYLRARLRHVRICNGDWRRVLTNGAAKSLEVRKNKNAACGIFLDPPYGDVGRASLYGAHESVSVAGEVQQWCIEHGDDPDFRIVYAGYDVEGVGLESAGWKSVEWFKSGFLRGGMGNVGKVNGNGHQQHRERLWLSPHCLPLDSNGQVRAAEDAASAACEPEALLF